MSFVDEDMNRELEARRNPVTRDTGGWRRPVRCWRSGILTLTRSGVLGTGRRQL